MPVLSSLEEQALAELDAAEFNGSVVSWWTPLDNHEPVHRRSAGGYGVAYKRCDGAAGFKFWPGNEVTEARRAIYIVDDGKTAVPYYVAGWKDEQAAVFLQAFPVNPDGRTRSDNGQVIDYSGWVMGPRRVYHLKVTSD